MLISTMLVWHDTWYDFHQCSFKIFLYFLYPSLGPGCITVHFLCFQSSSGSVVTSELIGPSVQTLEMLLSYRLLSILSLTSVQFLDIWFGARILGAGFGTFVWFLGVLLQDSQGGFWGGFKTINVVLGSTNWFYNMALGSPIWFSERLQDSQCSSTIHTMGEGSPGFYCRGSMIIRAVTECFRLPGSFSVLFQDPQSNFRIRSFVLGSIV